MCWVWCCVLFHFSTPSLIFIGGSHGRGEIHLQLILSEPTKGTNALPPCGKLRRWGPWAWRPTRVVGQPAQGANRPQLPGAGLVWDLPCLITGVWPVLSGFASVLGLHLVKLILNLCSDIIYDFMLSQSVLATCILAQKHILHILGAKV